VDSSNGEPTLSGESVTMKILHVTPFYYPYERGGERHVRQVAEGLAALGHQVNVLTTNVASDWEQRSCENGSLPESQMIGGVAVSRVPATPGILTKALNAWESIKGGYRSLSLLFSPGELEMLYGNPRNMKLVWSILRSDADVVVTWNWFWPSAYHAYLARRLKLFVLLGVPLFHTAESWVQRPIYDRMIRACDGFIVNTAHEIDFIQGRIPSARRMTAIGPGIDPNVFTRKDGTAFRTRHRLGQFPLVGFVGRMSANKGADTLVEAMAGVWKWNKDVRLVLAGYRSDDFPRLDQVLSDLSPSQRERLLVLSNLSEEEKVNLFDALDVFALPSTSESFGISYLEAWMCRKPVIGCRIGSTACVIQDGVDGLLTNPDDPADLARAILNLLSDPDRRAQMGKRGHGKTVTNFTWPKITKKFERFCLDLADGSRHPFSTHADGKFPLKSPYTSKG
jgi:glycosyltransferase involved in cell wall biosynthesis